MTAYMLLVYGIGYAIIILPVVGFVLLIKKLNKLIKLLEQVIDQKDTSDN